MTAQSVPPACTAPPKSWVTVADWSNVVAGVVLMAAFLEGALINSAEVKLLLVPESPPGQPIPSPTALSWLQFLFTAEGICYAFAEFLMVGIMARTPPSTGGGSRGCMQFAILMVGGIFFAFSGLAFPPCITDPTVVFSKEPCRHPAAGNSPYAWNAMAHYGILCFMVGTAIGFHGVLSAPKNKLISPFWGCTFYFLGAWTIGIFKFWGPVFLGGFKHTTTFDFTAPSVKYTANWWIALVGAAFLTIGAAIFLLMNSAMNLNLRLSRRTLLGASCSR